MIFDIDSNWIKIREGDDRAFELMFRELYSGLCLYAAHISGDRYLSEEIVQDVFLRIYQNRSNLVIKDSFKSYIFQSVHNQALNSLRQQKTLKQSVNIPSNDEIWDFIANNYEANDNVLERMISDETQITIEHVINELPEQCRRIFRMSRFDLLTNKEIAGELALSEHTVKSQIYKALEKIGRILRKSI